MNRKELMRLQQMNSEEIKTRALDLHKLKRLAPPSSAASDFEVMQLKVNGDVYYRLTPYQNFSGTYFMYVYGGYMYEDISETQWEFILKVAKETNAGVFVHPYPLAPEAGCKETIRSLINVYSDAVKGYDVEKIVLIGDSYGAGLALSLAMSCWKEGVRRPDQLIMLSPVMDVEIFDEALHEELIKKGKKDPNYFYTDELHEFLNTYWVRDAVAQTELTSPYYGDLTDICDDIVVFTGEEDMYNCYARAFYHNAKYQGVYIRLFEFEGEYHNFMLHSQSDASASAHAYLKDVINGTLNHSLRRLYPLKLMADWTKYHPDIIKDDWAVKFFYENKFRFDGPWTKQTEYRNMVLAAKHVACDAKVRNYMLKFPDATIVHIGCHLGSMFGRLDNGRVHWYSVDTHNVMSVRRSMYGERDREISIGRSIMDFSWLDEIVCERKRGLMFVCEDALSYLTRTEAKQLLEEIWKRFPGSEFVFVAPTSSSVFFSNAHKRRNAMSRRKKRLAINDGQATITDWRTDYRVLEEKPVAMYLGKQKQLKWVTKFRLAYSKVSYSERIIHIKLGSESYEV